MIHQESKTAPIRNSLVIEVSGPDAAKFLQGQLTCDVAALRPDGTLGAYCNIKGKVESLFRLIPRENTYWLDVHADLLESTLKELQKYAIFSKVKLATCLQELPPINEYQEILDRIPAIYNQTRGLFFPHDLNLPALGAVSFTKGCYRGQEIVARMQHRGNLKRGIYLFATPLQDDASLRPGNILATLDEIVAGTIIRIAKNAGQIIGLAVITHALAAKPLKADKNQVTVLPI